MKDANDPIVLSGRVYVSGLLACDRPELEAPASPAVGSLKLVAVPTERAGRKRPAGLEDYTGFFTACVWNGKRWRKFNLRAGAAVDARYVSNGDRVSTLDKAVKMLRELKDRRAVWGDKAYEVRALPRPAPQARVRKDAKQRDKKSRKKGDDERQLMLFD